MRERDTQRARVYKCDRDPNVKAHAKPLPSVSDVERFVRKVFASKRVQAAFPKAMKGWTIPAVGDGRARRSACGGPTEIKIPLWARTEMVVVHELAHTIHLRETVNEAFHGWRFCSIFLRLTLYALGREAHDALKRSMKENRVRFTEPRKRRPMDPERRAALVERLALYRAGRKQAPTTNRFQNLDL
jgi:putative metallohydrolase (TIGR04338 family)